MKINLHKRFTNVKLEKKSKSVPDWLFKKSNYMGLTRLCIVFLSIIST